MLSDYKSNITELDEFMAEVRQARKRELVWLRERNIVLEKIVKTLENQ